DHPSADWWQSNWPKGFGCFLVVLNSSCHHHHLGPSEDRCGSLVLGEHGLDHVTECLGDEDVLLRGGEDVLIAHLDLQDFLLDAPTPFGQVLAVLFFSA